MKDIVKHYTNGEVTVVWKPALCIHSAVCVGGLPRVFHPKELPWITLEHATSDEITRQVDRCPSGALTWEPTANS